VRWVWRAVVLIGLVTLFASTGAMETLAQGADDLAGLRSQVNQLSCQGKYADAAPVAERYVALARQKHGDDHAEYATAIAWLAYVYQAQGRYPEAEPLYKRALAIFEKALGPELPSVASALNNLAELYRAQGRYPEAKPLYKRTVTIFEKALGPDHPSVATALNNLAELSMVQRDWTRAADLWRRSTDIIIRRTQRGTTGGGETLTGKGKSEAQRRNYQFFGLVKMVHRLTAEESNGAAGGAREMFETAQWALASEAAASLAQMAARGARVSGTELASAA